MAETKAGRTLRELLKSGFQDGNNPKHIEPLEEPQTVMRKRAKKLYRAPSGHILPEISSREL